MGIKTNVYISGLKRRAERLKSDFKNGDLGVANFLISNHPHYEEWDPNNVIGEKIKHKIFLHALAKQKGFNNWQNLKDERIRECQTLLENQKYKSFSIEVDYEYIKEFNRLFTDDIINKIIPEYSHYIKDFRYICRAYIDLIEDTNNSLPNQYYFHLDTTNFEPEKICIAIDSIEPDFNNINEESFFWKVVNLYNIISLGVKASNYDIIKNNEKNETVLSIINQIQKLRFSKKHLYYYELNKNIPRKGRFVGSRTIKTLNRDVKIEEIISIEQGQDKNSTMILFTNGNYVCAEGRPKHIIPYLCDKEIFNNEPVDTQKRFNTFIIDSRLEMPGNILRPDKKYMIQEKGEHESDDSFKNRVFAQYLRQGFVYIKHDGI